MNELDALKAKKLRRELKAVPVTDVVEYIRERVPAQAICTALKDALSAVRITGGKEVADHRTRIEAAKLCLSYTIGTPVQRQEQVNYNFDMDDLDEDDLIMKLAESPAMRSKILDVIRIAETKSGSVTDV